MEKLGSAMQGLGVDDPPASPLNFLITSAMRRLAQHLGSPHLVFATLAGEDGFVSEENLQQHFTDENGFTIAQALDWLDANRDGKVCKEDFDAKVLRDLFAEQFAAVTSGCAQAALMAVAQNFAAPEREKSAALCLADMSDKQLEQCSNSAVAAMLDSLKRLRDEVRAAGGQNGPISIGSSPSKIEGRKELVLCAGRIALAESEETLLAMVGGKSSIRHRNPTALPGSVAAFRKTNPEDGSALFHALMEEGTALFNRTAQLPAAWFEEDVNTEIAMREFITLRAKASETMAAFCTDVLQRPAEFFTQRSMTAWHRLRVGDAQSTFAKMTKQHGGAAGGAGGGAVYGAATKLAMTQGLILAEDTNVYGGLEGDTCLMRAVVEGNVARVRLLADAQCDLNALSARQTTAVTAAVLTANEEVLGALLACGANPDMGRIDTGETPVLIAAEHGRAGCVERLVAAGANVTLRSGETGATALHEAVLRGAEEMVPTLLGAGAEVHAEDRDGDTPMHVAAMYGQLECGRRLLDAKGHIDAARASDGNAPMHLAAANGHVMFAQWLASVGASVHVTNHAGNQPIHVGHVSCCQWLVDAGADIHAQNKQGRRPMHVAAGTGQLERVQWLAAHGADIAAENHHGSQPLHVAVMFGQLGCAQWLAQAGADVHAANHALDQPLHLAALHGHHQCGEWLLRAGADVTAGSKHGVQAMHVAASKGHAGWVHMLQAAGADVSAPTALGDHPLHLAAWNGHADVVTALRVAGADVTAANGSGSLAVHLASFRGHVSCVQALCAGEGGDENGGKDMQDTQGDRPLHLACRAGHVGVVTWLVEAGADVSALNAAGRKAEAEAAGAGHAECVQVLQSLGAA